MPSANYTANFTIEEVGGSGRMEVKIGMNLLYAGLRIWVLAFALDYLPIAAYLTLLVAIS